MEHVTTRRCGAVGLPDGSVRWRVWAPKARQVGLVFIEGDRRRRARGGRGRYRPRHFRSQVPQGRPGAQAEERREGDDEEIHV